MDELATAVADAHTQNVPEYDETKGLIFSQDRQGNVGPGIVPQAVLDVYHSALSTMNWQGLPSDNPDIGKNVLTMGGTLAAGGVGFAEKGALGVVGGKLPEALGEKQLQLIHSLAAEDNPPKEIARILTAYYTPPGVRITEKHIKDVLSPSELPAPTKNVPQFYKGWNDEKQQYVEELLKSGLSRKEAQVKFNEKYPDSPITQGSRFLRMEQAQSQIDRDKQITDMVNQLQEAYQGLSTPSPK